MSETFPKKEDIAAILNELKQMREESERRWGEFRQDRQEMAALREQSSTSRVYVKNTLRLFDHTAQGLGARWELMSEEAFRNGLVAIFTDELGFRVRKYEDYDDSGSIFRHPEQGENGCNHPERFSDYS